MLVFTEFRQSQRQGPRGWFEMGPLLSSSVKLGNGLCVCASITHSSDQSPEILKYHASLFVGFTAFSIQQNKYAILFSCIPPHCWLQFISVQHENFQRYKTHLVPSITVSITSSCLVMQCRLFKPTFAFQCIIIPPEHFFMQIKADMMFAETDYPAQESFKSLQVAFHF